MGTNSIIGLVSPEDGVIRGVYCHFDGYHSHNGEILFQHYQDVNKIAQMIDLGGLSSLKPEIGESYDHEGMFQALGLEDDPHNPNSVRSKLQEIKRKQCTFYIRDYGRDGPKHEEYASIEDFFDNSPGFAYLFVDGVWWTDGKHYKKPYRLLSEVLENLDEDDEDV